MKSSFCFVAFLSLVSSETEEWYQACEAGECGFVGGTKASSTCFDSNKECRNFALRGECFASPEYMAANCRKSCGHCKVEPSSGPCKDLHSSCPIWANQLECYTNPGYMSQACPKSCFFCVDTEELEMEGRSEQEIEKIVKFSQTDFGLWQSIPQDNGDPVREEIANMARYLMSLEPKGPGSACNNQDHDCVFWKVQNGCTQHLEFMLSRCSLACQYCDIVDGYHGCRGLKAKAGAIGQPEFGKLDNIVRNLISDKQAKDLLDGYLVHGRNQGEVVLSIDKTVLWANPDEEAKTLFDLAKGEKSLEWKYLPQESFLTGKWASCNTACREANPAVGRLHGDIANLLGVDPSYLSPLEFVHYTHAQHYGQHHDFQLHDVWKPSGNRVMTLFMPLNKPEQGGPFGFPELEWLLIEEPEILVWPNSLSSNPDRKLERMESEQLPIVEGDLYGVYAYVMRYPHDDDSPCA